MTKPERPHYVYVARQPDGSYNLVIMSKKQEVQELPLTANLAIKFAQDFLLASRDLYTKAITTLETVNQKQEDMFDRQDKDGLSEDRPSH